MKNKIKDVLFGKDWDKYEGIGKKYLCSLGYKESAQTTFDFTTRKGVFDIKTKRLPSTQPYTFNFTKLQIMFFQKYSKKKYKISQNELSYKGRIWQYKLKGHNMTFFKVLIILIYHNRHEFRILDIKEDFLNPYKDLTKIGKNMVYSKKLKRWYCNSSKPVRLIVRKDKRTW